MISALELVRFQRLLAEFGSRAKKQAARCHQNSEFSKQTEISWRMYAVFRSGLQIIPVMPEHVQAGVTKLDEDESRSAITIACAKAYCRRPFVIATLDAAYDCWSDQYALYKASDTRSPAMIDEAPPMKSSEPAAPYVKESTESKYARTMTENGLPLPPPRPKAAVAKPEVYKACDTRSSAMIGEAPPMKSSEPGAPYVKESTESKYARIMAENGLPLPPQRPKARGRKA